MHKRVAINTYIHVVGIVMLTVSFGCSRQHNANTAQLSKTTTVSLVRLSQYGIGCYSYEYPNKSGPPSYSVDDIGKSGVDALSPAQVHLAMRIERFFKTKTLRFTIFDRGTKYEEFAVYDATQGPCPHFGINYLILNGTLNEFYQPGENQFTTTTVPGEAHFPSTPYPWTSPSS
jgi:hypothetical protein